MATNDFRQFAASSGANVLTPTAYAAAPQVPNGDQLGTQASSAVSNTTWRQTSTIAVVNTNYINAVTGQNTVDDGTTNLLLNNLGLANMLNDYLTDTSTDSTGSSVSAWSSVGLYTSVTPYLIGGKLQDGLTIKVKVNFTNTGNATFSFCGITASQIVTVQGTALVGGELLAGQTYQLTFNTTLNKWLLLGYQNTGITQLQTDYSNSLATTAWATQKINNAVAQIQGVPSGVISAFGGASIPSGWLACPLTSVAAQYPIASYPTLYAAISTLWNAGTVPTGYFCIPWGPQGYSLLNGPSSLVGTQSKGQVINHIHSYQGPQGGTFEQPSGGNGSTLSYTSNPLDPTTHAASGNVANLAAGMYTQFIVKI
jgi:hypothetical protein